MSKKTFFQRLIQNDSNFKIVHDLCVQANDWVNINGLYNDLGYFDLKDWFSELLEDSKLLKSLRPQQRKPFIKGLTEYTYSNLYYS